MKVLIKKATIIHHGFKEASKMDILVENGRIVRIEDSITENKATVVESADLHVSPGWLDIGAQAGQPGYEYRETFQSLAQAARAGGYTALATFPRNSPPIQSRIEIEYILQLNELLPVQLYPIGAISQDLAGKDLTEMLEMIHSGAIAFSDGRKSPVEAGLLTRALEYVLPFNAVIIDFPLDRSITSEGQIHEGMISASLGLSGIPSIAEEIIVQRDIQLVGYTGSRLHFHAISAGDCLTHLQKAKAEKMSITADVPAMHLLLEDKSVGDFDSHKKVLPPFRSQKDRKALIRAVKDGLVQHISSIHTPMEVETKDCEFTYASFGSIGLETAFAAAHTALQPVMPIEDIVDKFCYGPRSILRFDKPEIKAGEDANLTLFDPSLTWKYNGTKYSLSKNDALTGREFKGKVIGTLFKGRLLIN
jgi:dihydroorotase